MYFKQFKKRYHCNKVIIIITLLAKLLVNLLLSRSCYMSFFKSTNDVSVLLFWELMFFSALDDSF